MLQFLYIIVAYRWTKQIRPKLWDENFFFISMTCINYKISSNVHWCKKSLFQYLFQNWKLQNVNIYRSTWYFIQRKEASMYQYVSFLTIYLKYWNSIKNKEYVNVVRLNSCAWLFFIVRLEIRDIWGCLSLGYQDHVDRYSYLNASRNNWYVFYQRFIYSGRTLR